MASVLKGHVVPTFTIIVWQWFAISGISVNADGNQKWQLTKNTVLQRSIHMYNNPFMSDIKFIYKDCYGGEELYAHKYMLATSSPVFHQMFYGDSPINDPVIDLSDISKDVVAAFLAFLYKDECPEDIGITFEVLRLTKEYETPSFDEACRNDLEQRITITQAFEFLERFLELQEHTMTEVCWRHIDKHTSTFFVSEYFLKIQQPTLGALLARDTLESNERAILEAVLKWADNQCSLRKLEKTFENRREILGDTIYKIRFHTMTESEFSEFSGEIFRVKLILTNDEVVYFQTAIKGKSVRNLKWDLSKKKREMSTYLERLLEGNEKGFFVALFFLFIFSFLPGNALFTLLRLLIFFCAIGILYFWPNIAYKLIPDFVVKWL